MKQDLRIYSLVLVITLMLWANTGRADTCPGLGIYSSNPLIQGEGRDLYAESGTIVLGDMDDYNDWIYECNATLSGDGDTYYDGSNHLWVLDDDLSCTMNNDDEGEFKAIDY